MDGVCNKKDALDDALGDLNKSTKRLRRKFDATDTWMETKGQVESVLDDARRINPALVSGRAWNVATSHAGSERGVRVEHAGADAVETRRREHVAAHAEAAVGVDTHHAGVRADGDVERPKTPVVPSANTPNPPPNAAVATPCPRPLVVATTP
jgi:hypothetical protein